MKTPLRTLSWHLLRAWTPSFCATLAVLGSAGWLVLLGTEVLRSGMQPTPWGLCALAIGILPQMFLWLVPVAAGVALVGTLSDWRTGGQWVGLMAAGLGGRALWPVVAMLSLAVAIPVAGAGHLLAPSSQTWVQRVLLEEALPMPGRGVALGPLRLQAAATDGGGLREIQVAVGSWHGLAATGRLEGDTLLLSRGGFQDCEGDLRVAFDAAKIRLPVSKKPGSHRHPVYQQAIVFKRSSWPVSVVVLLLLCVPAGLGGRNWLPVVALGGHWGMVRAMDHLSPQVGAVVAAWLPTLIIAAATAWIWNRWRDL